MWILLGGSAVLFVMGIWLVSVAWRHMRLARNAEDELKKLTKVKYLHQSEALDAISRGYQLPHPELDAEVESILDKYVINIRIQRDRAFSSSILAAACFAAASLLASWAAVQMQVIIL